VSVILFVAFAWLMFSRKLYKLQPVAEPEPEQAA
jgi:hypothetical protein